MSTVYKVFKYLLQSEEISPLQVLKEYSPVHKFVRERVVQEPNSRLDGLSLVQLYSDQLINPTQYKYRVHRPLGNGLYVFSEASIEEGSFPLMPVIDVYQFVLLGVSYELQVNNFLQQKTLLILVPQGFSFTKEVLNILPVDTEITLSSEYAHILPYILE